MLNLCAPAEPDLAVLAPLANLQNLNLGWVPCSARPQVPSRPGLRHVCPVGPLSPARA